MILGTVISAAVFLLPIMIWHLSQDNDTIIIKIGDTRDTEIWIKHDAESRTKPHSGNPDTNIRKGNPHKPTGMLSGFKITSNIESILASSYNPNLVLEPISDYSIDISRDRLIDIHGKPTLLFGNYIDDGWPVKSSGSEPMSFNQRTFNLNFTTQIPKPKKNRPAIIQIGPARWPKNAIARGYRHATVVVVLIIDETGSILDKKGKIRCRIIDESPPGKGFGIAFLDMLRDGYYSNPIIDGVAYSHQCTITYEFCCGNNCKPSIEVTSGNAIVSVQGMEYQSFLK